MGDLIDLLERLNRRDLASIRRAAGMRPEIFVEVLAAELRLPAVPLSVLHAWEAGDPPPPSGVVVAAERGVRRLQAAGILGHLLMAVRRRRAGRDGAGES